MRRALRDDDGAVTEVIGFVLSFALSAIFLLISMSAFYSARDNSDQVVTATELNTIADRVATAIVQTALVAQEFPNATLNVTISLPQDLNGHTYTVQAATGYVYVNTTDLPLSATASNLKLDAVTGFVVDGGVVSSNEKLLITYSLQSGGTVRSIHLHEES